MKDTDAYEFQSNNLLITLVAYAPGGRVNEILQVHLLCFGDPCISSITSSEDRISLGNKTVSRLKSAILILSWSKSISGWGGFEWIHDIMGSPVLGSFTMDGTGILIDAGICLRLLER